MTAPAKPDTSLLERAEILRLARLWDTHGAEGLLADERIRAVIAWRADGDTATETACADYLTAPLTEREARYSAANALAARLASLCAGRLTPDAETQISRMTQAATAAATETSDAA